MDDMRPLAYGVITALFPIAMITIPMRIWVRGVALQALSWDDWMMASMLIFFPTQQAILYFFLDKGAGEHLEVVLATRPEVMTDLLKVGTGGHPERGFANETQLTRDGGQGLLAEEFYYVWMQFSVKLCFLLFFFRLSSQRPFRIALWSVIVFHVGSTIAIWLLYALQCQPLEAFYYKERYPDVQCISNDIAYFIPYSLNLFVDVCIFVLPLPTIITLQMSSKRKLAVIAVVTAGGSAVLCGGLRAIILFEFSESPDFTWALGKMVIISAVEIDMGIIAANMPAIKAFYKCWRQGKLGAGQGKYLENSSAGQASAGSRSAGLELSSNAPRSKTGAAVHVGPRERLPSTESERELWELPRQKPKKAEYESSWRSEEVST
ncbi:uncharacterized protein F5Z01DRAFT_107874 [Emericellopsis atlantica]|uniref:Rhodopsin domain-containing protein n=1 Tax=Emericellopsis atlantica TaxID=2614577 RepID=A0A9P7ZMN8_9HYPO|nr:uncharacterized protein F5Z01DRAFT_107874 [Emericellopsis atlantica]KAG9254481.1 hypothetical protein F5Z01DRAFT_107874 [Emericellopsis atlantica]